MSEIITRNLQEIVQLNALKSAQLILGAHIITPECRIQIVEVEAYRGADDPGSHSNKGVTPRNKVMFGNPGHAYVYFTYGNHWMLNIVVEEEGVPAALLIRGAKPLEGKDFMHLNRPKAKRDTDLLSGPGKITAALRINKKHNSIDLLNPHSPIKIEPGTCVNNIKQDTRIGLAQGKGDHLPWRFIDADEMKWASKPHLK